MLDAISPVDGRYRRHTASLAPWMSELGLIHHRVEVEVEYFLALVAMPLPQLADFPQDKVEACRDIHRNFNEADAQWVKDKERITNHDVKAVEYFVKDAMERLGVGAWKEFVHFGLTSQDVNNTAIPLSLKRATEQAVMPLLDTLVADLAALATTWKSVPMLARTHGQPASPVTLGKEIQVFVDRLLGQRESLASATYAAKFGGATGQFNAHHVAYPDVDWPQFGREFVEGCLGLTRTEVTTQIEPYDHLAAWCDALRRIHTVLIDLDRDIWTYISMDYFKQKIVEGEVGSSAMPHKVNPIDFENSEGNLGVANALLSHFAEKLPISRLQRDLTDSTVLRNLGVPLGHSLIAMNATRKGLGKLVLNEDKLAADLENNWAIVAEAIQTILRREAYPEPYEALKALTRTHGRITSEVMAEFIEGLDVGDGLKAELRNITPANYLGFAQNLVRG
ncbi:MAG: adenylosuccinate lyase [Bacteroidota bacterium]|nr:adenylosuccinate lyase [Bacteroidota bacterium]MEC8662492.1 adenylosuccinate lyase [Bacteroidota bacterium]